MTKPIHIVRYGELVPCKTAFIDAHTPGSDKKENFTIIGGGVSEAADQHVHIKKHQGLILEQQANLLNAVTHYILIEQLKFSLFYQESGDFFGGDGEKQEK